MPFYWVTDPSDNAFMEITQREDIEGHLEAPRLGRGGQLTASYRLVPEVPSGAVIVHYYSPAEAIVGVSIAVGSPEPAATYWKARGTSARRAGAEWAWLPGVKVPLAGFTEVLPPITLEELRRLEPQIMAIRDDLERRYGTGTPLYFPWVRYARGAQPMRAFQVYLAKLPRQVIDLLPRLRLAVNSATTARSLAVRPPSEIEQAEAAVARAAGRYEEPRPGGQGFQTHQATKVAIEAHAMNSATDYFLNKGWDVADVHGTQSYDLRCSDNGVEKHVEVKGTTTAGAHVILTPNEVEHARAYREMVLFVLANISINQGDEEHPTASGGDINVLDPWSIDDRSLRPVGFRLNLPTEPKT
jgi:Domain of unknown function (DUF3883)